MLLLACACLLQEQRRQVYASRCGIDFPRSTLYKDKKITSVKNYLGGIYGRIPRMSGKNIHRPVSEKI